MTIGLKRYAPSPVGYVHAIWSCFTLDLLICFSAEYCEESAPPRCSRQLVKGLSWAWVELKRTRAKAEAFVAGLSLLHHIDPHHRETRIRFLPCHDTLLRT